jgi:hypothetical protein
LKNNSDNEAATHGIDQSLVTPQSPTLPTNTTNDATTEEGADALDKTPDIPKKRKRRSARTVPLPVAKRTKGPLPLKRRTAGTIDRFVPYSFPTAKLKKVVRKKEVQSFPEHFLLAVQKHVCHEDDVKVYNLMALGTSTMGICNTPLEFLANSTMNEKYWSLKKYYGTNVPKYKTSLEFVKKLLNLPQNERAFQALLAKTEGRNAKRELQRWYNAGLASARLEADLMVLDSVQKIAWIPDNVTPEEEFLKGHYSILLKRNNGNIETIIPTNEWMAQNFNPEVLASCQRMAYERKESLVCIEGHDTSVTRSGYINVETEGITCSATDMRVINRLKYQPMRTRSTGPKYTTDEKGGKVLSDRKQLSIPHQWNGYCNATNENIRLTDEWVKANFQSGFLKQVMSATGAGTPYLIVPPGEGRPQQPLLDSSWPIIKYRQKATDKTCMSLAMANALAYLGEKQLGHSVFSQSKKCEKRSWTVRQFCSNLRNSDKYFNKITFPVPSTIDLLGDIKNLHLVTLLGSDGKEDHCVALTREWIFDPNFDRALPRSTTSLNRCCSSVEVHTLFVRPVTVAVFSKIRTI